jgi:hypothetical protein
MEHCRMLLRVDGSIVRVREIRFFHCFDKDVVSAPVPAAQESEPAGEASEAPSAPVENTKEAIGAAPGLESRVHVVVTWRELNLLPDMDSAAAAATVPVSPSTTGTGRPSPSLPLAGPVPASNWGVLRPQELRDPAWIAQRVPEVNQREDVLQYYTLYIKH